MNWDDIPLNQLLNALEAHQMMYEFFKEQVAKFEDLERLYGQE